MRKCQVHGQRRHLLFTVHAVPQAGDFKGHNRTRPAGRLSSRRTHVTRLQHGQVARSNDHSGTRSNLKELILASAAPAKPSSWSFAWSPTSKTSRTRSCSQSVVVVGQLGA